MFVELLIGAGLVVAGATALRALRNRVEKRGSGEEAREAEGSVSQTARPNGSKSPGADRARPLPPRGLRTGDVLLYADSEMWLAGEIHLDEEGFALSLFRTPGAPRASWVAQLDEEGRDVAFLAETTEVPDGSVPAELPIGGLRLGLRTRGEATVRTEGEHLPLTTNRCRYTILGGAGGRTLVVVDFDAGDRLSLVGDRVTQELYDLLPGGDA